MIPNECPKVRRGFDRSSVSTRLSHAYEELVIQAMAHARHRMAHRWLAHAQVVARTVPLLHGDVEDDRQLQIVDAISAQADVTGTIWPCFHVSHAR
jgi:hypothetical protein